MAVLNTGIKQLNHLALLEAKIKFPNIPDYARPVPKYKDSTTNDLTQAILKYITLIGGYAVRIQVQGQWNESIQKWTKSNTRKGTADIHACINGKHYSIEIKTGKDKMSDDQIKTKNDVIKAGGIYLIASKLDDLINIL